MSSRVVHLFVVCCVSLAAALPSHAAEIRGQIAAVDEHGIAVIVSGDFEPQPGDKFAVLVEVPNIGEASIAKGEVSTIEDGIVLGKIVTATGKVTVGQKVTIDSPQAARKRPAPANAAAILGKIGAVVDQEITIVTTSKVDPAVGDKVEVFVEIPKVGPASVGVGKVTAVEEGLITARIEQATGTLAFGQQVKINSANPPPAATGAPAGSAPEGEVLGLKLDPVDAPLAELLDLPKAVGLVVRNVASGSPGESAGLKKRDVLLRADGAELNDFEKFRDAAKGGGELKVEIWRNGAAQTVVLKLPTFSTTAPVPNPAAAPASAVWIGLRIENFRDDVRATGVVPGSPAARAGFRSDDRLLTLDGEEVLDRTMFVRAVSSGAPGKSRRIEVARGDERLTIEVLPEPLLTNEQLLAQMKKLASAGDHDAEYQVGMMYQDGLGVPARDLVEASRWLRKAAEAGVAQAESEYGAFLMTGTGVEKNLTEGVKWVRKAADKGYPTAVNNLGKAYYLGLGVEKNEAEARDWYARALKLGSLKAMLDLGELHEHGVLYEKDPKQAAEFYRTAAHRGHPLAQTEWGRCLHKGIGVEQDQIAAIKWLKLGSDAGDSKAHYWLGTIHYNGVGVPQDFETAVNLYRKAAALGYEPAMLQLGLAYRDGSGVKADDAEAYRWIHAAAERGHVAAYFHVGNMLAQGRGVPQNDEQAVAWFRKSADAGVARGQFNLSVMYRSGRGVEQSDSKALEWCHKAAQQKLPEAENGMGGIAYQGRGVDKSPKVAFQWFKASAEHGLVEAQYNLALLYEKGEGVAQSQSEAIKWYRRAASQNDAQAIEALKRLGAR